MSRIRHSTSRFKTKFRLFPFSSSRQLPDSVYADCLTTSPCQLPTSSCFLTPLDVRNPEQFTPLTDREVLSLGEDILPPPPPPRRKLSYGLEPVPTLPVERAPKVRPFVAASQLSFNGSIMGQTCFICNELLETKLEQEQLVQLNCGDCVHSECLATVADFDANKARRNQEISPASSFGEVEATIFPVCRGTACSERNMRQQAVPVDEEIVRRIVEDVMLSLKLSENAGLNIPGSRSCSVKSSWSSEDSTGLGITERAFSDVSLTTNATSFDDTTKNTFKPGSVLSPQPIGTNNLEPGFVPVLHDRATERESRPTSPAISNLTTATASVRISFHQLVLLEHLRSAFIRHMVHANHEIDFSMLVAVGALRLVDRLQICLNNTQFCDAIVYLFLNYLVIWREDLPVEFFDLTKLSRIDSSGVCILLLRFDDLHSLIDLCSDVDSIIQKWGIALSDPLLVFPQELFSSTISVSETSITTKATTESKVSGTTNNNCFVAQVSPILEDEGEISSLKDMPPKSDSSCHSSFVGKVDTMDCSIPSLPEAYPSIPQNLETCSNTIGVYIYSSSPTTPLNIPKFPLSRRFSSSSKSDSDSDSDEELIERVTGIRI